MGGNPDLPSTTKWELAIKGWYDEVHQYDYGMTNTGKVIGHYTQVSINSLLTTFFLKRN